MQFSPPTRKLDAKTLREGAERLGAPLDDARAELFERYYRRIEEANARMNLTAVSGWEETQRRHFLDSLALVKAVGSQTLAGARFADVGSGAGLPGIPLAIAFPALSGALIEATMKKATFLAETIERLPLPRLVALRGRAETLARRACLRERFDLVTARAVAATPALAELTLPFCRVGGVVALHKTRGAAREIESADYAIQALGGAVRGVVEYGDDSSGRLILTIDKIEPTPDRYPRRPGIPAKRPLSGAIRRSGRTC